MLSVVITCFPSGAVVKKSTCQYRRHKRCRFDPWVGKIPWSRKWQPAPVFLPGKFHGQSLAGYGPRGHKELNTTERAHTHCHYYPPNLEPNHLEARTCLTTKISWGSVFQNHPTWAIDKTQGVVFALFLWRALSLKRKKAKGFPWWSSG